MQSLRTALLCCLMLPLSAAAEQHIVDRHIEAIGGAQVLAAIETMHRSGDVVMLSPMGETNGSFEEAVSTVDDSGYTRIESDVFDSDTAWLGERGWKRDSFQGQADMQPSDLGFAKVMALPSVLANARSQWGLAAFREPTRGEFEGTSCTIVQLVSSPLEFYIADDSLRLIAISLPNILDVRYSNHLEHEGVLLPHKVELDVTVSGTNLVYSYQDTSFGAAIDPQRLGELAVRPSAKKAGGEEGR